MESQISSPFYKRLAFNLISVCLIGLIIIYGKSIVVPLALAVLFANLLLPVTRFLTKKRFNRPLAILAPLVSAILVIVTIVVLLSAQVGNFLEDVPALSEKGTELVGNLQQWIDEHAHMSVRKQNQYFRQGMDNLKEQAPKLVGVTFVSIAGVVTYLVLIPIFTFLTLYYRKTIKEFLVGVFKNGSTRKVNEVLEESTTVAQQYMTGLLIETVIVFTLNVIGFLIIGIKYPVFLALLAAILNLVPYVGILVANLLCMATTLLTSDRLSDVVWVGVVLGLVQLFDNNFGMPVIVGNKVKINALVTIIGVLIGGAMCGVPGMFLAIPSIAVLKIVFDKVPELNPWGIMLGDDESNSAAAETSKSKLSFLKRKHKMKKESGEEKLVNQ
ncbi:MAG TPA: AI-2E family transporter [Cyclobacteriaceae bacterium]|nr:AI-2E family transporter [Cyclobacteriaceae bacterium]